MSKLHKDVNVKALLLCIGVALLIFALPTPTMLNTKAWILFAVFISTILGIIVKPLPLGATVLTSIAVLCLCQVLDTNQALKGFGNSSVWLVVFASFIAKGFVDTGLGRRISYILASWFGKSSLGLSYSLIATDLVMAPVVPSLTARSVGILFPIVQSVADSYHSFPNDKSSNLLGKFLVLVSFQASVITSAMFLTSMVANPMAAALTQKNLGLEVSWVLWAKAASVPGLICLILLPLVVYLFYPPQIKSTPEAPDMARAKLAEMGKMSVREVVMCGVIVFLLIMWSGAKYFNLGIVIPAMIGLSVLLLTDVLQWKKLLQEETVWDTFVWFGFLLMLSDQLVDYKIVEWFTSNAQSAIGGINWKIGFVLLSASYFYVHYLFASATAHITSMYIPFLMLSIGLGTPAWLAICTLLFIGNLMGGLTHYGCVPAPIIFGRGYTTMGQWWKIGFIMSVVNLTVFGLIGSIWWKYLGLW